MSLSLQEKRDQALKAEWEGMCDPSKGCRTVCCFFEGSPCEELQWVDRKKGIGRCRVYLTRHGRHKTINGKEFMCVDMKQWLALNIPVRECGYHPLTAVEGVKTQYGKTLVSFTV